MVNTVKFSEFDVASTSDSSTQTVGLTSGVNTREPRIYTWTTAGRPATPFNGLLGLNTTTQTYEWWDAVANMWVELADTNVLAVLASHAAGQGASLIGLQNQSNVTDKFVQDLANATFIAQTSNGSLQNAQYLGSLTTGIVKNTTVTGVLSISAPLTSIDGLTTVANQFLITTAPDTYGTLGALTDGQLIIGATGLAPVAATLTQGSGVTITNSPGGITISATGTGGTVTSLSGGTGITLTPDPITTTGSIALTVPVAANLGGTGLISPTAHGILVGEGSSAVNPIVLSSGQILIGSTGSDPVAAAIGSGTGILVGNGAGSITVSLAAIASHNILSNITGGSAAPIANTLTATIDAAIGSTQGDILYRDASAWVVLAPGTSGQFLQTQGAAANPQWVTSATVTPAALTKVDDTNVTLTLGGTPATALLQATSITVGWSGTLAATRGGTGISTYTTGDTLYSSAANTLSKLAGNTTTTKQYLSQTGDGVNSAAPAWATISGTDITGAALTKTDDTNVTMTLGGTPTTALLRAASMTLGWTGQLSVARGGTGLASITAHNLIIGNGTSAATLLAPSATSGIPLISQGSSADPAYGTAVVSGGGTGNTTFTAYSVICAGTTATGAFQNVSGVGTSGQVLTSNGAAALPTWQTNPASAIKTIAVQKITATGAFTYTPTTGCVFAIFELQAAGGGSGGTTGAGASSATAGAGAGGGYLKLLVAGTTNLGAITGSVGAGGTAGASGNNTGGSGGNTTLVVNSGSTWTAGGGTGGGGQTAGAAAQAGGTPGTGGTNTAGTNGTLQLDIPGQNGSIGYSNGAVTTTGILPTLGGGSLLGNGGAISNNSATGVSGSGFGGGAGGGLNGSGSNQTGTAGQNGIVVITEFCNS